MTSTQIHNTYKKTAIQAKIHPVKLIAMLFQRALVHLEEVEKGVVENNPRKRGEHLGKVIAIVTELYASLKEDDDSEACDFLRGLYEYILSELPKVGIDNDLERLQRVGRYMHKLNEMWQDVVIPESDLNTVGTESGTSKKISSKGSGGSYASSVMDMKKGLSLSA